MSEFSAVDFYKAALDIEKYLNYLRSNELAYEYAQSIIDANDLSSKGDMAELYQVVSIRLYDWQSPCPDGQFKFRFHESYGNISHVRVLMPYDYTEDEVEQIRQEIFTNLDQAWNNGAGWSDGLYEYVNDLSRSFVKPDVPTLAGAVHDLAKNVVQELNVGAVEDWAYIGDLLDEWSGQSAHSFYGFYHRYGSALKQFGLMTTHVAAGFAAATRIIDGTQRGALEFVTSVRDSLETMLVLWIECGGPPPDVGEFPAWVADVGRIALDVWPLLQAIPPVKAATTAVDTVITVGEDVVSLIGTISDVTGTELHLEQVDFEVQTADQIYTKLTETLHTDYYQAYVDAMSSIYDGSTAPDTQNADDVPFRAADAEEQMEYLQNERNDWYLPEVAPESMYAPGDEYGW